jgi:uncharacterized membrane protein
LSLFSLLKRNTKHALHHNWGKAIRILLACIGVGLVLGVFLGATTYAVNGGLPPSNPTMEQLDRLAARLPQILGIELLITLFSVFLLTPLSLGVTSWYVSLCRGKPEAFGGIFAYFERIRRYGRSLLFSLNMIVRTFLWAVAFFALPAGVLGATIVFTQEYGRDGNRQLAIFSALGMMLACFMLLLALLLYCAYMNKYALVPYLMAYDDTLAVRAAIRRSAALTAGNRFRLMWYALSFLGWFLLSVICPPVFLYSIPYRKACYSMYALYLMERAQDSLPEDDRTREFPRSQQEACPAAQAVPPDTSGIPPLDQPEAGTPVSAAPDFAVAEAAAPLEQSAPAEPEYHPAPREYPAMQPLWQEPEAAAPEAAVPDDAPFPYPEPYSTIPNADMASPAPQGQGAPDEEPAPPDSGKWPYI